MLKTHLTESQARTVTHAIQQAEREIALDVKSAIQSAVAQCATKTDLANVRGELTAKIADSKSELLRWMFLFWITQVGVMLGYMKWGK